MAGDFQPGTSSGFFGPTLRSPTAGASIKDQCDQLSAQLLRGTGAVLGDAYFNDFISVERVPTGDASGYGTPGATYLIPCEWTLQDGDGWVVDCLKLSNETGRQDVQAPSTFCVVSHTEASLYAAGPPLNATGWVLGGRIKFPLRTAGTYAAGQNASIRVQMGLSSKGVSLAYENARDATHLTVKVVDNSSVTTYYDTTVTRDDLWHEIYIFSDATNQVAVRIDGNEVARFATPATDTTVPTVLTMRTINNGGTARIDVVADWIYYRSRRPA